MKTVGKQLQDARVARDWSPELAARETKIKIERLRDLESDDFSNFSSPTYARGFVRTYARALGLDEYKLLRQLDNKLPEDDNASFANDTGVPYMPEPSKVSTPYRFGTGFFVAMGAGATVLLLIAFILFQSYRVGYFTGVIPVAASPVATNSLSAIPDADAAARALPADSNAAPVALPVDVGPATASDGGTNAAPVAMPAAPVAATGTNGIAAPAVPVATVEPAGTPTTPLDTSTPPRALPVDLSTLAAGPAPTNAAPAASPSTNTAPVVSSTTIPAAANPPMAVIAPVVATPTPVAVVAPTPTPVNRPPPSLSARAANARPAPAPVARAEPSAPSPVASVVEPAVAPSAVAQAPVVPIGTTATAPVPATTLIAATAPPATLPPAADAAPALTGEAPVNSPPASAAPAAGAGGKRLVLKASRDSYIRVVSLDNPDGEQVRYSSVLHEGQSISFNDRKYSINIGVPSAVDILLDGINYGPHSDHSEPDTFTVESHQP